MLSSVEMDFLGEFGAFASKSIALIYHGVIFSKKNSKQIVRNSRTGNMMLLSSKNARSMEARMVSEFRSSGQLDKWKPDQDGQFAIRIGIVRKDNVRRDLDNQATSILDALVLAGVIPDDSVKYVKSVFITDLGVDKNDPRALIEIDQVV